MYSYDYFCLANTHLIDNRIDLTRLCKYLLDLECLLIKTNKIG